MDTAINMIFLVLLIILLVLVALLITLYINKMAYLPNNISDDAYGGDRAQNKYGGARDVGYTLCSIAKYNADAGAMIADMNGIFTAIRNPVHLLKLNNLYYFGVQYTNDTTFIISQSFFDHMEGHPVNFAINVTTAGSVLDVPNNGNNSIIDDELEINEIFSKHMCQDLNNNNHAIQWLGIINNEYIFYEYQNHNPQRPPNWDHRYYNIQKNSNEYFDLYINRPPLDYLGVANKLRPIINFVDTTINNYYLNNSPNKLISFITDNEMALVAPNLVDHPFRIFGYFNANNNMIEIDQRHYNHFTEHIDNLIFPTCLITEDIDNNYINSLLGNQYYWIDNANADPFTPFAGFARFAANLFTIHLIDNNTGIIDIDGFGAGINIGVIGGHNGTDANLYQILFYQPCLDYIVGNDSAHQINELSRVTPDQDVKITINGRSYVGFMDFDRHKIKLIEGLTPIGNSHMFSFTQFGDTNNIIAKLKRCEGYILTQCTDNDAVNDRKIPVLFYDNIPEDNTAAHNPNPGYNKIVTISIAGNIITNHTENNSTVATYSPFIYDLLIDNLFTRIAGEDINTPAGGANSGIDDADNGANQQVFIICDLNYNNTVVNAAEARGADDITFPPTRDAIPNNFAEFVANDKIFGLYIYGDGTNNLEKRKIPQNILLLLIGYAYSINADINAIIDFMRFGPQYPALANDPRNITINPIAGRYNTITYRYNLRANNIINSTDINYTTPKIEINLAADNWYNTMVDDCYHPIDLGGVVLLANFTHSYENNHLMMFCHINTAIGLLYRSANLAAGTPNNIFSDANLAKIKFGNTALVDRTNIDDIFNNVVNNYIGCKCYGFYNNTEMGNTWNMNGIVKINEAAAALARVGIFDLDAHSVAIFDEHNINARNFYNAAGNVYAANFALYSVQVSDVIIDTRETKQSVILFDPPGVTAVNYDNCNLIIPLQSDKTITEFEHTEFYYYFGRYENNKYYLSDNIYTNMCSHMASNRGANYNLDFINMKNLRIDHLMKYRKYSDNPGYQIALRFEVFNIIDVNIANTILKKHMYVQSITAGNFHTFEHSFLRDTIVNLNAIDLAPNKELHNIRLYVPRIEPYTCVAPYNVVPYNGTRVDAAVVIFNAGLRILACEEIIVNRINTRITIYNNNESFVFFGNFEIQLDDMGLIAANKRNSTIFRYIDNIQYGIKIRELFNKNRPYKIYSVGPNSLNAKYKGQSIKYLANGVNNLSIANSATIDAFDVDRIRVRLLGGTVINVNTMILHFGEEAPPEVNIIETPIEDIPADTYIPTVDPFETKRKSLENWFEIINKNNGFTNLIDQGKVISNTINNRHNHPSAIEKPELRIKDVVVVLTEKDYNNEIDKYMKEVSIAKKKGDTIPPPKIYFLPNGGSKKQYFWQKKKHSLGYKTGDLLSLIDNTGSLNTGNIPNGIYFLGNQKDYLEF